MERLTQALARTPLHHWHAARNARFVERDGWQIVASYSGIDGESAVMGNVAGLVDLSPFAKLSFRSGRVAAFTHALVGNSPPPKPGGVAVCSFEGRVLACRLTEDHLLLFALTTTAAALHDRVAALAREYPIVNSDVTCAHAAFCLLGVSFESVLGRLTALDVGRSAFPPGSCAETSLAGVHALLVRPPGMASDMVYITVAWDLAEYVWERLLDAGRSQGIEAVGLEVWRRLLSDRS
jgi:heterotetrameric sarcosine oxidase gamma subunit